MINDFFSKEELDKWLREDNPSFSDSIRWIERYYDYLISQNKMTEIEKEERIISSLKRRIERFKENEKKPDKEIEE